MSDRPFTSEDPFPILRTKARRGIADANPANLKRFEPCVWRSTAHNTSDGKDCRVAIGIKDGVAVRSGGL